MSKRFVMALDQGTTSSRCILFNRYGQIIHSVQQEFRQIFPQPGWVEHDPMEIWGTQIGVATQALNVSGVSADDIAALGITNQRESVVVWNRHTGLPIYNAIVWQCRRTADYCDQLRKKGFDSVVLEKTGLILDPYFSGTKLKWILDNVPKARQQAEAGDLLFGTIDTWLIWHLTKGKVHVTDYTNASRTMLFNIHTLDWDDELLAEMGIPRQLLPQVHPSSYAFGESDPSVFGASIPIAGIAGDQQAALFGQMCVQAGEAKNTYGTGCFLLMNTGDKATRSSSGLLTTMAASLTEKPQYALEGSIFIGGSVIQWLRDELRIVDSAKDSEQAALSVADNGGVYIVPAFVGMGAPYWNAHARGTITGLTRGASREHIIRACLESMAYQTKDVLAAMESDSGIRLKGLRVDGGACANNFLMQFQADLLDTQVQRPEVIETTALGAAYLAGLQVGYWSSMEEIAANTKIDRIFEPGMQQEQRSALLSGWERAIGCTLHWAEH